MSRGVDIQVPAGQPEVNMTDAVQTDLSYFRVDQEALVAGLALAEWPEQAIDTVKLDFRRPRSKNEGIGTVYNGETHGFDISLGIPKERLSNLGRWSLANEGVNTNTYITNLVNYTLAVQAQRAADKINHSPNEVDRLRLLTEQPWSDSRQLLIWGLTIIPTTAGGAVIGNEMSPGPAGVLLGGVMGGMLNTLGTGVFTVFRKDNFSKDRLWSRDINTLNQTLAKRAADFAQRPEVHDLFRSVVVVDLKASNSRSAAITVAEALALEEQQASPADQSDQPLTA